MLKSCHCGIFSQGIINNWGMRPDLQKTGQPIEGATRYGFL